jgi:very-short-patch-repair endonuclease
MDVFDLRKQLVEDYGKYTRSFINIADPRIKAKVDGELDEGALWPEPLLQLNPTFLPGGTIDALVADGVLHPECNRIFRIDKTESDGVGKPLLLHTHQARAIRKAREGKSYVLTSGTGSGKSLAYIVPIVDHVLRHGSGRGIQAIVVYPMNALANSQAEELKKFLERGYPEGESPVRVARYTGQEKRDKREEIRSDPPDVLLTNYMMLELLLTRREDRELVRAAQGLQFLVFDELHTYRGRQGADVALLIRRCRLAFGERDFICVGTSATMATEGSSLEQRREVAKAAQTLFGAAFDETQVIGESLERATPELPRGRTYEVLREAIASTTVPPEDYQSFCGHPLASWIESTFGVTAEEGTGELIRQRPERLGGSDGAAARLAAETGADHPRTLALLRAFLLKGSDLKRSPSSRFPIFAFRLHQFLTRGDTVWATIEKESDRHLEFSKLVSKPGEPDKLLFPFVFCRQCGTAYYRVTAVRNGGVRRVLAREDRREDRSDGQTDGYLYVSIAHPWPSGDGGALLSRLPASLKEQTADGGERVRPDSRKDVPEVVHVDPAGAFVPEGEGLRAAFVGENFHFCLEPGCGVVYSKTQRSERSKLATLGVDNRSTATTILAVRALLSLQGDTTLNREARKLLSFTDNRQDASLQAGHFNDFTQVALLRSALFKAAERRGPGGLGHADLSAAVFDALALKFEEFAADPEVRGPARTATTDALRRVIQYHIYRDLQRGWRVTAPNLEDCGLIRYEYEGLTGGDGLLGETELWTRGFSIRVERNTEEFIETPMVLKGCSDDIRLALSTTLLDVLRRNVAIKVDVLDPLKQRDLIDQTQPRLQEGTVWYLSELKELVQSTVAFPRAGRPTDRSGFFISSYGSFGRYVRRAVRDHVPKGDPFGRDQVDAVIRFLLQALRRYGIVEQVRSGDTPGYQINPEALRWIPGDGVERPIDRTRLLEAGEIPAHVNDYFVDCYRRFADLKAVLEAREHTAQVDSADREEREERFRSAELPLLFCSPTMELGVDISQLNVVNLRNVPPTPANYAQRSGRAGRGGQPALVYTYCAGRSPHDQYYFKEPEAMVAGAVAPPRIDLRNSDLVRSHVHAVWMEVAKPDLGKTLKDVIDIETEEGRLNLPVKQVVSRELQNPVHRSMAAQRAGKLISSIRPYLDGATWFHDEWTGEGLDQIGLAFDGACERWRSLYRSAVRQRELHHRIIGDHSRPDAERNHSRRLRAQAESQIKLLTEAEGVYEGDFYSYRYFAAEGFLPGYNFPRLPLSAYVPGRAARKGKDEFLSRPRFLAISEFGPRALVYHEGSRYRVYKVNLDFGSGELEDTHSLPTATMKRCTRCGYGHLEQGGNLKEVCERCNSGLDRGSEIPDMVQLQNVSLRLAQRITCDEEERQRFGYKLVTSYRFPEVGGRLDRRDAEVFVDDRRVMRLSYGDATTLFRVNLGWRHQGNNQPLGFILNLERGYWATNAADQDDAEESVAGRQKRVVPYVTDTKNALVIALEPARSMAEMASLQSALKEAIQQQYQLEPRELASEPLPSSRDRNELLFFEASEGGAGVLRQLVEDPQAIGRLARRALQLCHFDPDTLEDLGEDTCGKACYHCLLDYGNQTDHQFLDRQQILGILAELRGAETRTAGGTGTRAERMVELRRRCDSGLEKKWLDALDTLQLRPPTDAQYLIEVCSTRPDFYYCEYNAAIYVDGPPHDTPEQIRADEEITRRLKEVGYIVIRFHHAANWNDVFRRHPDVFGIAFA